MTSVALIDSQSYSVSMAPVGTGEINVLLPANMVINGGSIGNLASNELLLNDDPNSFGDLKSGNFGYPQTWDQHGTTVSVDREVLIKVPNGLPGRLPVVIMLHGSGGVAAEMIDDRFAYLNETINIFIYS